ncbi:hypothetical protein V6N12_047348 [Hibiscus sabdariffa]|uniref:Uncharacterized protein n=1 Tax=Hibiscus sabdariffa TaxID=183260 RepID=A0ABR2DAZ8_9ROSI
MPTGGHTEAVSDACNVAAASENEHGGGSYPSSPSGCDVDISLQTEIGDAGGSSVPTGSEVITGADSLPAQAPSAVDINEAVEVVVEAASDQEIHGHEARLGVSSNLAMEVNEESHRFPVPNITIGQIIQPAAVVQSDDFEAIVPTGAGSRNTHTMSLSVFVDPENSPSLRCRNRLEDRLKSKLNRSRSMILRKPK